MKKSLRKNVLKRLEKPISSQINKNSHFMFIPAMGSLEEMPSE